MLILKTFVEEKMNQTFSFPKRKSLNKKEEGYL